MLKFTERCFFRGDLSVGLGRIRNETEYPLGHPYVSPKGQRLWVNGNRNTVACAFNEARRLKELEHANTCLKRIVANLTLDKEVLQEIAYAVVA